jgi:NitT/TauT family transport system substrate-binding protein
MRKNNKTKLKITALIAVLLAAVVMLSSCEWLKSFLPPRGGGEKTVAVYMPDGAPLLSFAKLRSDNPQIVQGYGVEYSTILTVDALSASLIKKEPDIAVAPINLCATVSNNGSGYILAGVGVWGNLHIVSNQSGQITLDSLKGNIVLAFGRGLTPGITLRAVLKQSGIKYVENDASYSVASDEVNILYLNDAADVKNLLAVSGKLDGAEIKYALLAEPVSTAITGATSGSECGPYKAVINLQTEWANNNDGRIFPQAGVIFKESLLKNDKEFVDKFIEAVKSSSEFAENNPFEAGELAKNQLDSLAIPNGTVVKTAVEAGRLPLNFVAANAAKDSIAAYLSVILEESPILVGGKLPSDGFYY